MTTSSSSSSSDEGGGRGSACHGHEHCLPQLYCLNFTCTCPQTCPDSVALSGCPCGGETMGGGAPLLSAMARAYWPSVVIAAIFVLAALTTIITCVAHIIARRFAKSVVGRSIPLPEISTLGDAYGTDTLYCTPSPSATPSATPWPTPVPTHTFNFFNRKGSCPNPSTRSTHSSMHSDKSYWAPFLLQSAIPVVSCAMAPVNRCTSSLDTFIDEVHRLQITQHLPNRVRRSTVTELPCTNVQPMLPTKFSSQADLRSLSCEFGDSNQYSPLFPKQETNNLRDGVQLYEQGDRNVPTSLDIEALSTPKLTSISSNDTFLTANTSTPQENSKYSFQSVMDSSLDSYLTLTLSSQNASPPSFSIGGVNSPLESPQKPPLLNNMLPKSILKKESYGLPEYVSYSPVNTMDSLFTPSPPLNSTGNGPVSHEIKGNGSVRRSATDTLVMDPVDRDRLESVKRMISEKLASSLASLPNGNANYKNNYRNADNFPDLLNNNMLETHL